MGVSVRVCVFEFLGECVCVCGKGYVCRWPELNFLFVEGFPGFDNGTCKGDVTGLEF